MQAQIDYAKPPNIVGARPARSDGGSNPKSARRQTLRKIHFWIGAVLSLNFALLALTGLLVQHRALFRLEERTVHRRWLPSGYRPDDPDVEIRADIVAADLHSGRLFGRYGPVVVDACAAGLVLMIVSGFTMQMICRFRNGRDGS